MKKYLGNAVKTCCVLAAASSIACSGVDSETTGLDAPALSPELAAELQARHTFQDMLEANPSDLVAIKGLADLDRKEDARLGLLYRLELAEGQKISFYEPEPGALVIVESGSIDDNFYLSQFHDAIPRFDQAFADLAPEEPVPQALLDAQARLDELREIEGEPIDATTSIPDVAPPSLQETHATTSGSHFENSHDGCPGGIIEYCWLNRTNDYSNAFINAISAIMRVAAYRGSFDFTFQMAPFIQAGGIAEGEVKMYGQSVSTRANASGTIQGATGDGWHYGGAIF